MKARNRFKTGGDIKKEKKNNLPPKSLVLDSFQGLADIFNKPKENNTSENVLKKNSSYYDNDRSDGMTIDNNGDISFHGKKGLEIKKQRQKDGLSTTNVIKPRSSKSK